MIGRRPALDVWYVASLGIAATAIALSSVSVIAQAIRLRAVKLYPRFLKRRLEVVVTLLVERDALRQGVATSPIARR